MNTARRQETMKQKAAAKEGEWVEARCAYCQGRGKDPFGIPSPKSNCCVCGGKGIVRVREPYVPCAFCQGAGMHPNRRLTCTVCKGKGAVHVREPMRTCAACGGTGRAETEYDLPCTTCGGKGVVST